MVKIGKSLRIEREQLAREMHEAFMSADVEHLADYHCMTPRMTIAVNKLYDWAERAANQ
jgi:hypothetical protein